MHMAAEAPSSPLPLDLAFHFRHGPAARDLAEFHAILDDAPDAALAFHRDHFAPWLHDVLKEVGLARRVEALADERPAPDVLRDALRALVERRLADGLVA